MVSFYYLVVCYDICDLCLCNESRLEGPFGSVDERAAALKSDMDDFDLECSTTVNVTLLSVQGGVLVRESSEINPGEGSDEEE